MPLSDALNATQVHKPSNGIFINFKWWERSICSKCYTRTQAYLYNKLYIDPKWCGLSNLALSTQGFSAIHVTQGHKPIAIQTSYKLILKSRLSRLIIKTGLQVYSPVVNSTELCYRTNFFNIESHKVNRNELM